jgi:hypothetical protein
MALDADKLTALKAFYFGVIGAKKIESANAALKMLDSAIMALEKKSDVESKFRLAFYRLTRGEFNSKEDLTLKDRLVAQELCKEIKSSLFDHFMAIEEATTTRTHLPRETGSASPYAKHSSFYAPTSLERDPLDCALEAIGEKYSNLTSSQERFIKHTNLKQLLDKHGIRYSS